MTIDYSTVDIPASSTASMVNRTCNRRKTLFTFVFLLLVPRGISAKR
ncbi:hypothetical protein [Mycobacterium sp. URHB0044]|nr:hypothetical protein [Mycobacterium sp. URHB0044]